MFPNTKTSAWGLVGYDSGIFNFLRLGYPSLSSKSFYPRLSKIGRLYISESAALLQQYAHSNSSNMFESTSNTAQSTSLFLILNL